MFTGRDVPLAFVGGFLLALVVLLLGGILVVRLSDVYGLGHWKLNARMPFTSMWMNLGYWTDSDGKHIQVFQEACAALQTEILKTAGIVGPDMNVTSNSLAVLDLGFGCGDQTWDLCRLITPSQKLRYVGLTLNEAQVRTADRRIQRETLANRVEGVDSPFQVSLFHANAAKPGTWKPAAREAVLSLADEQWKDRWLLALDCLYHFRPSRRPIFTFAAKTLNANAMMFDLILNEKASTRDTLMVRAVGIMMGCPVKTFLTEKEYRDQLMECGYDKTSIIVRDVSEHVFSGVSGFINQQERALSDYGISMGGFKLAGRLFEWFGRSGVLKAVIVVARTTPGPGEASEAPKV